MLLLFVCTLLNFRIFVVAPVILPPFRRRSCAVHLPLITQRSRPGGVDNQGYQRAHGHRLVRRLQGDRRWNIRHRYDSVGTGDRPGKVCNDDRVGAAVGCLRTGNFQDICRCTTDVPTVHQVGPIQPPGITQGRRSGGCHRQGQIRPHRDRQVGGRLQGDRRRDVGNRSGPRPNW